MSIYARIKIREWIMGEWPPHNFEEYVFIKSCIQHATKANLLTPFDISSGLRYACGYVDIGRDENIQRFFTVMAELTGYNDHALVQRYMPRATKQERETKIAVLRNVPLWINQ